MGLLGKLIVGGILIFGAMTFGPMIWEKVKDAGSEQDIPGWDMISGGEATDKALKAIQPVDAYGDVRGGDVEILEMTFTVAQNMSVSATGGWTIGGAPATLQGMDIVRDTNSSYDDGELDRNDIWRVVLEVPLSWSPAETHVVTWYADSGDDFSWDVKAPKNMSDGRTKLHAS